MREILFRGKRTDGQWITGGVYQIKTHCYIVNKSEFVGAFLPVDPDTVGQYTGMDDSDGNKIFEGDVVGYTPYYNIKTVKTGVVRFGHYSTDFHKLDKQYGFYLDWMGDSHDLMRRDFSFWTDSVRVLGNIYDNPELLEGEAP